MTTIDTSTSTIAAYGLSKTSSPVEIARKSGIIEDDVYELVSQLEGKPSVVDSIGELYAGYVLSNIKIEMVDPALGVEGLTSQEAIDLRVCTMLQRKLAAIKWSDLPQATKDEKRDLFQNTIDLIMKKHPGVITQKLIDKEFIKEIPGYAAGLLRDALNVVQFGTTDGKKLIKLQVTADNQYMIYVSKDGRWQAPITVKSFRKEDTQALTAQGFTAPQIADCENQVLVNMPLNKTTITQFTLLTYVISDFFINNGGINKDENSFNNLSMTEFMFSYAEMVKLNSFMSVYADAFYNVLDQINPDLQDNVVIKHDALYANMGRFKHTTPTALLEKYLCPPEGEDPEGREFMNLERANDFAGNLPYVPSAEYLARLK